MPGYMYGQEVVKTIFDPNLISPEKLIYEAKKQNCAGNMYTSKHELNQMQKIDASIKPEGNFKSDSEPKYYLLHSDYKNVPMIPLQACKINSALAAHQNPDSFLSPRQLEMKATLRNKKYAHDQAYATQDFLATWKEINILIEKHQ